MHANRLGGSEGLERVAVLLIYMFHAIVGVGRLTLVYRPALLASALLFHRTEFFCMQSLTSEIERGPLFDAVLRSSPLSGASEVRVGEQVPRQRPCSPTGCWPRD